MEVRNRFKALDLINRVPEELWTEAHDIVQKTFHSKMGTIKDRNHKELTEAEEIKKRWQEYTEVLYKQSLIDPDNHDGVVTHLEPDILGV